MPSYQGFLRTYSAQVLCVRVAQGDCVLCTSCILGSMIHRADVAAHALPVEVLAVSLPVLREITSHPYLLPGGLCL